MQGLSVIAGTANSAALIEMPEPSRSNGAILVRTPAIGVCGTDAEFVAGVIDFTARP